MWKTRNEIKYGKQVKGVWTEESIKRIIVEYEKHTGKTEHFSLKEISA